MKLKALVVALGLVGVAATAMAAKAPVQKQDFKAIKAEMAEARTEMGFSSAPASASAKASGPTAADVGGTRGPGQLRPRGTVSCPTYGR